jgi:hypothetical protein
MLQPDGVVCLIHYAHASFPESAGLRRAEATSAAQACILPA